MLTESLYFWFTRLLCGELKGRQPKEPFEETYTYDFFFWRQSQLKHSLEDREKGFGAMYVCVFIHMYASNYATLEGWRLTIGAANYHKLKMTSSRDREK